MVYFDDFEMKKSDAINKILVTLDKITAQGSQAMAAASAAAANSNENNGGCLTIPSTNEQINATHSDTGCSTSRKKLHSRRPMPESIMGKSRSSKGGGSLASTLEKGKDKKLNKGSAEDGNNSQASSITECTVIDYKLSKVNNKLGTINTSIDHMNSEFKSLKIAIERQEKMHRIVFAIQNCHHGAFEYFNETTYTHHQSTNLVKAILFVFRRDEGYALPTHCTCTLEATRRGGRSGQGESNNNMAQGARLFHENLLTQIHALTGVHPRIEKSSGKHTIWYS